MRSYKYHMYYIVIIILLSVALIYFVTCNNRNHQKAINYKSKINTLYEERDKLNELITEISSREGKENIENYSQAIEPSIIKSSPIDLDRLNEYTLIGEYKTEDNDKLNNMKIELYAQVEVTEDGDYAWDDGQNWLLISRNKDEIYVLIDEYVQLGKIGVYLYKIYDDSPSTYISTIQNTHTGLVIRDYHFQKENNYFIEEVVFNKGNDQNTDKLRICR